MNWEIALSLLVGGLIVGALTAALVIRLFSRSSREVALEIFRENEEQRKNQVEALLQGVRASFADLSLEALSRSTEEFLKLAQSRLDSERQVNVRELDVRKELIDRQVERISVELAKVSAFMSELEKDRIDKFGQLTQQTAALMQVTHSLREALGHSRVRGQWGERMAEDVLRIAGFVENVNYIKQTAVDSGGSRPDFTFLLPRNVKLNMDVKFPLDNYVKYLEVDSESEKIRYRDTFIRNVKEKIKEVASRNYISAEDGTLDYALLFIPNETHGRGR